MEWGPPKRGPILLFAAATVLGCTAGGLFIFVAITAAGGFRWA
jgi:hypothetical protein